MPTCSRCGSERLFGGRCLDCGEVVSGIAETGSFGAIRPAAVKALTPSAFAPDHVVPFKAPAALRVSPAGTVASLHQQTIFSMARAMRRSPDALGAETDVVADPAYLMEDVARAARPMPIVSPEDLEPDPAYAATESAPEENGALDLKVSLSDLEPATTRAEPAARAAALTPPARILAPTPPVRAHAKTPSPQAATPTPPTLPVSAPTPSPAPAEATLDVSVEPDPPPPAAQPVAAPAAATAPAPAAARPSWVPVAGVLAAVAIFLALDWRQSANRADSFLSAADTLAIVSEGDVTADVLLERVDRLCREEGVRCVGASAWVRDSERAAWLRSHATERLPDAGDAVFYEAGFKLDATFPGWVAPWRAEPVSRSRIGWASARRVIRGEAQVK